MEQKDIDRFWSKVDKSGGPDACWPWIAGRSSSNGYGHFWLNGKTVKAHQIAWRLQDRVIPEGLIVRHQCHTRFCCNPAHLATGTHADNSKDMTDAGRQAKGIKNAMAVLTDEIVTALRKYAALTPQSIPAIARKFNLPKRAVFRAITGAQWKHVLTPPIQAPKNQGDIHAWSKLTEEKVREIRKLLREGEKTQRQIAKLFNIHFATICYIAKRKTWKHAD